jgi:hypothetical protein
MNKEAQSNLLYQQLSELLNKYSRENESNTPDFILSAYMMNCLEAFENATKLRDNWFGGARAILDSEKNKQWIVENKFK